MTLWLRALVALAEEPSLVPSTHIGAHNHLKLYFQIPLQALAMHVVHIPT